MKKIITLLSLSICTFGFAQSLSVSCSDSAGDMAYQFQVSEQGEVEIFQGLYDGFYSNLLNDGSFTAVEYRVENDLQIIEGMVGPNVSMRVSFDTSLPFDALNTSVEFIESDQENLELICEGNSKL